METIKDKQWFIDRIGKRVYRDETICNCDTCVDGMKNGVFIKDELQAIYMYDAQGMGLIYYDNRTIQETNQPTQTGA